jgi:hypothetical protein
METEEEGKEKEEKGEEEEFVATEAPGGKDEEIESVKVVEDKVSDESLFRGSSRERDGFDDDERGREDSIRKILNNSWIFTFFCFY